MLNWELMKNPVNWVIILLMVLFAVMVTDGITEHFKNRDKAAAS